MFLGDGDEFRKEGQVIEIYSSHKYVPVLTVRSLTEENRKA